MKKTAAELKQEIENIESRLSPERLFWDGERDRGEAMAEGRRLNARLREMEAELSKLFAEADK